MVPSALKLTKTAKEQLDRLAKSDQRRHRKVLKTLKMLQVHGPDYPGLRTHPFHGIVGPNGESVFESYVENRTPGAWRIWWVYGPETGEITVIDIDKHP